MLTSPHSLTTSINKNKRASSITFRIRSISPVTSGSHSSRPAAMAVYYRYKSGVDTFSVPVPAPSIPVADLKRLILGTARHGHGRTRGRGQRESVALYDSTTGEEYTDGSALVPRSSTVLVRRVAGPPAEAITLASQPPPEAPARDGAPSDSAAPSSSPAAEEDDEDRAISAVIDAAQLKWEDQHQHQHRGRPHQWLRGSNRGALLGAGGMPAPPPGYVCHRCRVPGHFIQHCPTNGDPRYDLQPRASSNANLPSTSPASPSPDDGVPPELHCKICSKVMADAVVASRCCFGSFCDACIRAQIAAKSRCVCGGQARADDLIPNLTLRATIAKLLATRAAGSGSASAGNRKSSAGSNAEPTSRGPAASQENLSHASATASSEHSDGNASSSTSKSAAAAPAAAREQARTKRTTAADSRETAARTGYGGPFGPACYDPFFCAPPPWACDPSTYYGMPYCGGGGGGGGYMNVPVPGGYHDGWGWQGRKRTADGEYQRHAAEGGFKRRCRSTSEVAV